MKVATNMNMNMNMEMEMEMEQHLVDKDERKNR